MLVPPDGIEADTLDTHNWGVDSGHPVTPRRGVIGTERRPTLPRVQDFVLAPGRKQ